MKTSSGIIVQVLNFILATEATLASIKQISDIDSEPFFIAVFASLSFLHYDAGNMFLSMVLCLSYYCFRILCRLGEDNSFRLIRSCFFNCIGFIYIFIFTRNYLQRERENFIKHYNQEQIFQLFKNLIKANHDGIVITLNEKLVYYNK